MTRLRSILVLCLAGVLTGCLSQSVPTQSHPSCSWTTTPPPGADRLCNRVFTVLRSVTNAMAVGDDATIRRYAAPAVAKRIIRYGRQLRPLRPSGLHVVPSFTLSDQGSGEVGAGFYVLGTTRHGPVNDQESVYLRVTKQSVRITHDQPQQYW